MNSMNPENIVSSFLKLYEMEEFMQYEKGKKNDLKSSISLQLISINDEKVEKVKQNITNLNFPFSKLNYDDNEFDLSTMVDNLGNVSSVLNAELDGLELEVSKELEKIQNMVDTLADLKMGSTSYSSIDQCVEQLLELKKELLLE